MKHRLFLAVFALLLATNIGADQPAEAIVPELPAEEHFLYERSIGDRQDTIETSSRLVKVKGESLYEVTSHSPEQDTLLRLYPATLLARYTEIVSRGRDATLRRVTTILENKDPSTPEEFMVTGMDSLPYTLRAFPWGSRHKAKIAFLGTNVAGSFRFDLSVTGKETLVVGDRGVECWKVQLSLGGIFGPFFGKSYLWYSTANPHFLVRSESASAGPGSPTSVLSLKSYTVGQGGGD